MVMHPVSSVIDIQNICFSHHGSSLVRPCRLGQSIFHNLAFLWPLHSHLLSLFKMGTGSVDQRTKLPTDRSATERSPICGTACAKMQSCFLSHESLPTGTEINGCTSMADTLEHSQRVTLEFAAELK